MVEMTDQKPTCHNCRTYGTPQCPDCGGRKYDTLCIEHPRLREWLMRDVVKELELQANDLDQEDEHEYGKYCGFKDAIALIRGVME